MTELADAIDALLPQTQCAKCGYAGCRPYAEAIASGDADINRCPPGGDEGVGRLARLLGCEAKPLDAAFGTVNPRVAAVIDESRCIGCMLCIKACPIDAIVGAAKRMHTVLTEHCSGCDLCVPPCPVDCIDMVELGVLASRGNLHAAALLGRSVNDMSPVYRRRFERRQSRLAQDAAAGRLSRGAQGRASLVHATPDAHDPERKRTAVQAALERARARRSGGCTKT